jgi:hypothetical protein
VVVREGLNLKTKTGPSLQTDYTLGIISVQRRRVFMGIFLAAAAAFFCALSNLCMRKSIDHGGTTRSYLAIQLVIAFFVSVLLNPVRMGSYEWNVPILFLGIASGLILGLMMISIGKALEKGPAGLTFASVSGSTVFPGLLMAGIFGAAFGFEYHLWHGLGSILVLGGLFWAGWGLGDAKAMKPWLVFCFSAFTLHILFLILMQWRSLLMNFGNHASLAHVLSPQEAASHWFMPMIYLAAALLQVSIYLKAERRMPRGFEWLYGILGGTANSLSTFFIIKSTEVATGLENAMIFPIFSVMIILLCNTWGQRLYKEKINWKASQVCALGLLIGTVDWRAVLQFLR